MALSISAAGQTLGPWATCCLLGFESFQRSSVGHLPELRGEGRGRVLLLASLLCKLLLGLVLCGLTPGAVHRS
jgi:hypothetical protein